MRRFRLAPALVLAALAVPATAAAQDAAVLEAYYRAVGDHFRVSPQEVNTLSEWRLAPDEVPVVLFLANRGGISPDAIVALRRGGRGWSELASRYGVGADDFHVPLGGGTATGPLAQVYDRYASTPSASWAGMSLSDDEIVGLVNVRVLSGAAGVPAARVMEARGRTGSYVGAFGSLVRGG